MDAPLPGAMRLADVLVDLEHSWISAAARRRLQWVVARAFGEVLAGAGRSPVAGNGHCRLVGPWRWGQAQYFAGETGAAPAGGPAEVASRLGRLSEARNTQADPDVGLPEAIAYALASTATSDVEYPVCACGWCGASWSACGWWCPLAVPTGKFGTRHCSDAEGTEEPTAEKLTPAVGQPPTAPAAPAAAAGEAAAALTQEAGPAEAAEASEHAPAAEEPEAVGDGNCTGEWHGGFYSTMKATGAGAKPPASMTMAPGRSASTATMAQSTSARPLAAKVTAMAPDTCALLPAAASMAPGTTAKPPAMATMAPGTSTRTPAAKATLPGTAADPPAVTTTAPVTSTRTMAPAGKPSATAMAPGTASLPKGERRIIAAADKAAAAAAEAVRAGAEAAQVRAFRARLEEEVAGGPAAGPPPQCLAEAFARDMAAAYTG